MKTYLALLFSIISLSAFPQSQPAPKTGGVALRVNDSTSYISSQTTAHSQGYADIFWNNQASTPHYDIWNGSSYDHVFTFEGGGGGGGGLIDQTLTDDVTVDVSTHSLTFTTNNSGVQISSDGTAGVGILSGDPGGSFIAGPDGAKIQPDKSGPDPAQGSLFVVGSDGYLDDVPIGTNTQVLTSDGTTVSWETPAAGTAKYILDTATPSTAGGTITLDMNSQIQRVFVGSASFATAKDIAISNTTNAVVFNFHFEITNTAAALTLPSGWLMSDPLFTSHVWSPTFTGLYEMGGTYDGTNWKIKILGPFN